MLFTPNELDLISDDTFFRAKSVISKKILRILEDVHAVLEQEVSTLDLIVPKGFDASARQFVKGEHLEDFPYQYLDFPRHFRGNEKFTFRSLFWWGHHVVFSMILEGENLLRYKKNLVNRYPNVANRGICLSLGPTLWEWKRGAGYTMEMSRDRRTDVVAVLTHRPFFKLARFIPFSDPVVQQGQLVDAARETLQSIAPVITL